MYFRDLRQMLGLLHGHDYSNCGRCNSRLPSWSDGAHIALCLFYSVRVTSVLGTLSRVMALVVLQIQ